MSTVGLLRRLTIAACLLILAWLFLDYFIPSPPKTITIATGSPNQTYEAVGKKYREILGRSHVDVVVRNTSGAVENLRLLNENESGVQVAVVQGGIGTREKYPELVSLGRITYQLFWIFYRDTASLDDLRQLKGKRIALGVEGSGGRVLAEDILNSVA